MKNGEVNEVYRERVLGGLEPVDVLEQDRDVVALHHTRPFFVDAHLVVVPKAHVSSLLGPCAEALLPALNKRTPAPERG